MCNPESRVVLQGVGVRDRSKRRGYEYMVVKWIGVWGRGKE